MKKLTNEEFLRNLKNRNIKYIPLEEYKGSKVKINWMCFKNPHHIFEMRPSDIYKDTGCPYCSHKKVFVGETDLWTTNPEIAKMLKNPQDGYKYSYSSTAIVVWLCPNCGKEIESSFDHVYTHGICCKACSDGLSYSEKFMSSMLNQLKIEYLYNKSFKWSNNKKYDFYIEKYNMIIECHGLQHYEDKLKTFSNARSLLEEKENDLFKQNIAFSNGIKEYIVLDCRKSDKNFIRNSILNSKLSIVFDLSDVNWDMCDIDSQKSYYADILKYYNNGIKNPIDIANNIKLSYLCVLHALHKLSKNGLCDYNSSKSFILNAPRPKRVICFDTGKIYESIRSTINDGFEETAVSKCCTGNQETHKGLRWGFYEEE